MVKKVLPTLIVTLIFITLAFTTDVAEVILYLDGGLIAVIEKVIGKTGSEKIFVLNWSINFSLTIIFLILFFISEKPFLVIVYSILFLLFLFCFILFQKIGGTYAPTEYKKILLNSCAISAGFVLLSSVIKSTLGRRI